ncbi:putative non-specific lipid-transfer protein 14 [Gastrolobium bilobum]|uniref:putative non-specific lipid-transfer protein 14 n=1 Tax=Gastrolobium bilobum TaxID=150636 RepID=UPI002AB2D702|nr:putative non-specific lipid-transfer protein 14 [Gastrolobium bilobum]
MELCTMGRYKALRIIGVLILLSSASFVCAFIECSTVTQLFSACSIFVTYGSPDPIPGSPCCDALSGLNIISNSGDNKQYVCKCLMGMIDTYNPNATAIGTLPGLCGISLGFTIDPNTDCTL